MNTEKEEISKQKKRGKPIPKGPLRSINGNICLTECYPKNHEYIHPILMNDIKSLTQNTCAIDNKNYTYLEDCRIEDNIKYSIPKQLEIIFLNIPFDNRQFLSEIYDIHSFDDAIYWTKENLDYPQTTIIRIHNCAWKAYGNNITNLAESVIDYYYDMISNHWIHDYYTALAKEYVFVVKNDETLQVLKKTSENYKMSSNIIFVIRLILFYHLNRNTFNNVIKMYIKRYLPEWNKIDSHYLNLKKYCYRYLHRHISKIVSSE